MAVSPQPDTGSSFTIGVDQHHPGRLERTADDDRAPAVQLVLPALKSPHGATAHPGLLGQLFLRPVEQRSGCPTLMWGQHHVP